MLKYVIIGLLILVIIGFAAFKWMNAKSDTLKPGDKMPVFSLPDQDSNMFHIEDYVGKKNLVIYFYPKDDTPGCTKEACAFRDDFEAFTNLNAMVIGISADPPSSHRAFIEKYNLPFTLLSDPDFKVRKMFGVKAGMIPGRVTFVVDKEGVIRYVFDSMTNAVKHVEEAKKILKELNG